MNSTHQPMKILIRGQTDPQTGEESDTKGVGVGDAMPHALCCLLVCDNLRKSAVSISSPNLAPLASLRENLFLKSEANRS